jgi:glycosyltransferase involved in cell wall biosynthesis
MNSLKDKKIAVVMGKGIEGCGITRVAAEMQLWAKKHDVHLEIFSYDCKFYSRRSAHNMQFRIMTPDTLDSFRKELDTWDLVIFHSYPHNKFEAEDARKFYYHFVKPLKTLKAAFIHETIKTAIDKITYLVPLLNEMDTIFHFETDTWFAQQVKKMFPSKAERMLRFRLWADMDELMSVREKYSYADKAQRMAYIGRWITWKNIKRSLHIADELVSRNVGWECEMHGIEASMGSKLDIIDHPSVMYIKENKNTDPHIRLGGVKQEGMTVAEAIQHPIRVFPEYTRRWGLEFMAQNMFGTAFYSLPKQPEDYGNRMEYTQIEIIGAGTVPLYDEHWAKHNRSIDGPMFYDIPDLAIYSNGNDIPQVVDQMLSIGSDPVKYNRMRDVGLEVIKTNFDAETVIPLTLEKIFDMGKDPNKVVDDTDLYTQLADSHFAKGVKLIENNGKIPVLGMKEIKDRDLYYLEGWKQMPFNFATSKSLF